MENEKEETLTENNDSTNVEEVVEETTDNTPTLEDYEALKQKNKELYERAKKAEALAKAKKDATLKKEINETQSGLTREEAILYAKGYTDEEVELANKLAKVNETTPLKAIEDEIFKAKYEQRLQKEKSAKASLSPSSGAGRFQPEKPTTEMTPEEHKAYAMKLLS